MISLEEYTEEEKIFTGNMIKGGKIHDKLCDYLESIGYKEPIINDLSVAVWKAVDIIVALKEELRLATRFEFESDVVVEKRSEDKWAVISLGNCWSIRECQFIWEPRPSERDNDFYSHTRFTKELAMEIAREIQKQRKIEL